MDTKLKLNVGDRVTKGPTWEWGDQGGADPKGIVKDTGYYDDRDACHWVRVEWDNGHHNSYRVGPDFDDVIFYREATAEVPTDDQSQKADAGKSDPVLLEVDLADALAVVNRVLDYGKAKYGQRAGWKQVSMDRYDPAARRHRRARDTGEQFDTESGLDHMAHEITNLLFQLQTRIEQNPDIDFLTFNDPPQDHRKDI
jgi:hypothetical protein